jgi:hypothetical protein
MGFEGAAEPAVEPLDTEQAKDPAVTGAKTADRARAVVAELPVLPGFVRARGFSVGALLAACVANALFRGTSTRPGRSCTR